MHVLFLKFVQTKLPDFCPGRIISMSETVEVASRFPNTIVTLVKGPFWEWLLSMYVIVQTISPEFCCTMFHADLHGLLRM